MFSQLEGVRGTSQSRMSTQSFRNAQHKYLETVVGGCQTVELPAQNAIVIETPGGGGYVAVQTQDA